MCQGVRACNGLIDLAATCGLHMHACVTSTHTERHQVRAIRLTDGDDDGDGASAESMKLGQPADNTEIFSDHSRIRLLVESADGRCESCRYAQAERSGRVRTACLHNGQS